MPVAPAALVVVMEASAVVLDDAADESFDDDPQPAIATSEAVVAIARAKDRAGARKWRERGNGRVDIRQVWRGSAALKTTPRERDRNC
jgi:hypothetical protein